MHLITPLSRFLLVILVIFGLLWALVEIKQLLRRRKLKRLLVASVYKRWTDVTSDAIEWKIANPFSGDKHPHQQWFIRLEVKLYERYLMLKGNSNHEDHVYLYERRSRIRNVHYEPPEN